MIPVRPILLRPRYIPSRKHIKIIKPRALPIEQITEVSYFVGKNILLFTMFYCGLNYLYYKEQNKKDKK